MEQVVEVFKKERVTKNNYRRENIGPVICEYIQGGCVQNIYDYPK